MITKLPITPFKYATNRIEEKISFAPMTSSWDFSYEIIASLILIRVATRRDFSSRNKMLKFFGAHC